MEISVIVIGDELLIGQVTDTNSGMIARTIAPYGWSVRGVQTVGDNGADITRAIDEAFGRTDVVITTGGLGPTKDDLTKQVLCDYFGGTLVEDPSVTENILRIFERRGIKLNALTAAQALVPTSCRVIQNLVGTAPIMWFERADGKVARGHARRAVRDPHHARRRRAARPAREIPLRHRHLALGRDGGRIYRKRAR